MNFLLDDNKRAAYESVIAEMGQKCPELMSRKFERANIQQAFVLDAVRYFMRENCSILSVGHYEDTAYETLVKSDIQKMGVKMIGIDPILNMDLDRFYKTTNQKFDIIFSTSVIEHVGDDETFVDQISKLLNYAGVGILTCDFKEGYKKGDPIPPEDARLYTSNDIIHRLRNILLKNGCDLLAPVDYSGEPDFRYANVDYSFASFVFQKFENGK